MAKDEVKKKILTISGILVPILLAISYFIKINVESGANYATKTSLLGYIIFYNPFILGIYVLIAIYLVYLGNRR